MSTHSAESRDNSPDGEPEKRSSKKRKVLSCYACRSRKMKCDRVYPVCGRCQKTGRADQCTYDPRLLEDLTANVDGQVDGGPSPSLLRPDGADANHITADSLTWKLRVQERRLEQLERRLASTDDFKNTPFNPPSFLPRFDRLAEEPKIKEEMMFRGKGFKTQFYGSTSSYSLITQVRVVTLVSLALMLIYLKFHELQSFTQQALSTDTSMGRVRADFKTFRNKRKALAKEQGLKKSGSDQEMFSLVPDKVTVDAAVSLYFQRYEDAYRILHEPSFWKEYRAYWEQPAGEERSPGFAATLVLIIALTKCLVLKQEIVFIGDSSADREEATNLIDACDAWLLRHSRKHLTLVFFQLQCLSLLAKRVNCIKIKQDWVNAGEVIRLAIGAGMHRDPALLAFGRISEFEKEMRRRLWATIMELELQCSIDAGLQSSVCALHFDVQSPSNLPDEAIPVDCLQVPASRPRDHFTNSSYISCCIESLPLRAHLMQLLNNPSTDLQYSDVLHYDNQITTMLANLPKWDNDRAQLPLILLDLQLRQFLMILHRPYAKLARKNPRFVYSLTATINAASTTISLHDALLDKALYLLNHVRNDIIRVVITLAQLVYFNSDFPPVTDSEASGTAPLGDLPHPKRNPLKYPQHAMPPLQIPELPRDDYVTLRLYTSGIELLDKARDIFEQKVMRLGTGYMEYWLLSSAIGIMPSLPTTPITTTMAVNVGPNDIKSRGKKAIDRMTSLCFRVLAMQKDPGNEFAASLRMAVGNVTTPSVTPNASIASMPSENTPLNVDQMQSYLGTGATGLVDTLGDNAKFQGDMDIPPMGSWDALQDMQVDLGGWNFPNFWSFDVGGEF